MWHFFRWHLPIERICIIYFPLGKLPGEYPDHIIVLPSSNRSKHEAILPFPPLLHFNLPFMLFSHSSFVPCLSFLTNFVDPCELISSKHEYSRLSIFLLFDYIVVIYRYGRTILRLNQTVDFFFFSLDCNFFLGLFFFHYYYFFPIHCESTQVKRFWHWFLAWQLH